ncbi:MAG: homoserine dehydrogenase [Betaproteobacteria bacterium]|nr:homoserine dehydrogenase [Betaproteobacteria bacterium]
MKAMRIALLGAGTVASGVVRVLRRNQDELCRRAGRGIEVVAVAARNAEKARRAVGDELPLTDDFLGLATREDVDIVAELMGGIEPARELVLAAIRAGKHVVTANKALLALHGNEIFAAAQAHGVMVAFEAAVAGGIPIIKAVREGLAANRIEWVAGIINGTTNYILSSMRDTGVDFATALAQAQRLGYAEADPTFDIDGIDAAHKITILCAIAFGVPVQFDRVHVQGIRDLETADIRYAEQLGYRIKLLGITRRTEQGIELRVHPTLIPATRLVANVEGAMNAVVVQGDAVGPTLFYGKGAGSEPTASSVIADMVDITRLHTADPGNRVPHLAFQPGALADTPILAMPQVRTSYYLRIHVRDEAGVLAEITRILAEHGMSIDALLQRPSGDNDQHTDVILLTHETLEQCMDDALARIQALDTVLAPVVRLRKEELR